MRQDRRALVVDDSPSMAEEQANLGKIFPAFVKVPRKWLRRGTSSGHPIRRLLRPNRARPMGGTPHCRPGARHMQLAGPRQRDRRHSPQRARESRRQKRDKTRGFSSLKARRCVPSHRCRRHRPPLPSSTRAPVNEKPDNAPWRAPAVRSSRWVSAALFPPRMP